MAIPLSFENELIRLTSHKKVYLFCHHKKTQVVFGLIQNFDCVHTAIELYKSNGLKGYKISKIVFHNQLQHEIIQQIITHCGEAPSKLDTYATYAKFLIALLRTS